MGPVFLCFCFGRLGHNEEVCLCETAHFSQSRAVPSVGQSWLVPKNGHPHALIPMYSKKPWLLLVVIR